MTHVSIPITIVDQHLHLHRCADCLASDIYKGGFIEHSPVPEADRMPCGTVTGKITLTYHYPAGAETREEPLECLNAYDTLCPNLAHYSVRVDTL